MEHPETPRSREMQREKGQHGIQGIQGSRKADREAMQILLIPYIIRRREAPFCVTDPVCFKEMLFTR